jgi:hypothetical protein
LAIGANAFGWRCVDSEPPKDGLLFEDCDNIAVSGLAAERFCAGSPAAGAAVTFRRCRDSSLSDSHILDPLHRGVELEDCVRCRVVHNTIVDRRQKKLMAQAIRVRGASRDNIVADNLVGGAQGEPIQADPDTADVRDNRVAASL